MNSDYSNCMNYAVFMLLSMNTVMIDGKLWGKNPQNELEPGFT